MPFNTIKLQIIVIGVINIFDKIGENLIIKEK